LGVDNDVDVLLINYLLAVTFDNRKASLKRTDLEQFGARVVLFVSNAPNYS